MKRLSRVQAALAGLVAVIMVVGGQAAAAAPSNAGNAKSCAFTLTPAIAIWDGEVTLHATAADSFGATSGAVRLHDAKKVHDVKTRNGTALHVTRWTASEITAVMPPIPPGGPEVSFIISVTRADGRDPCAYLDMFRKSTSSRSESPNSSNNDTGGNEVVDQARVPCAFAVSPPDTQYWGETITLTRKDIVENGTFANSEGKVPGQVELFDLNAVTSPRQIEGSTWSPDGRTITLQIPESWRGNDVVYGIQVRRAPTATDLLPVPCGTHSLNLQLVPKLSDRCPARAPVAAFWGETITLTYDLELLPEGAVGRNFGKNRGTVRLEPEGGGEPIVLQPTWSEASISVKLETATVVQQVLFKVAVIRAGEPDPCSRSLIAVGAQAPVPQCPVIPGVAVWGQRMALTYAGSGLPNNKVVADFGAAPGGRVELTNASGAPVPLTRVWAAGTIDVQLPAVAPFSTGVTTISVIRDGEAQACASLPLTATYIDCSLLAPFVTEAFQHVTVSGSRLSTQQVPMALPGSVVPVPITRGPIDKTDLRIPEAPVTTNQLTQLLNRGIGASIEFGVVASGGSDTDPRQFRTDSGSLTFGSDSLSPARSILGLMTQPNVVPYPTAAANRTWTLAVRAKVAVPGCPLFDGVVARLALTQTPVVVPRMAVFFTEPDFKGDALVILESLGLPLGGIFGANQADLVDVGDVAPGIVASSRKEGAPHIRDAVAAVLEWGVFPALDQLSVFDISGPNHVFPPSEHADQLRQVAGALRRAPHWAVDARGSGTLDLASDPQVPGYMQWNGNSTLSSVLMVGAPGGPALVASGDHKCWWAECVWYDDPIVETLQVPSWTLVASLTDFRAQDDGTLVRWPTNTVSPVDQPRDSDILFPPDELLPPYPFEYFDDFFRWLSRG